MVPQLTKQFDRQLARLPAECPMSYDQAVPALLLGEVLRLYAAETHQRWHIGVNDPIDYLKPDGRPGRVFPDLYAMRDFVRPVAQWHLRTWVLARVPDLVLEVTVPESTERDLEAKRDLFLDQLGVREYVVFDVHAAKLPRQLVGWHLEEGGGRLEMPVVVRDGAERLVSAALGLELGVAEAPGGAPVPWVLRAYRPGELAPIPTHAESRVSTLESALRERDAEIARLRAELERRGR